MLRSGKQVFVWRRVTTSLKLTSGGAVPHTGSLSVRAIEKMIQVDLPYTGILFREIIILLLLHAIDNGLLCWQGCYLTVKSLNFLYSSRRNVKTHRLNTTITSVH